jgi:addiction module RelE/StbE family toxin
MFAVETGPIDKLLENPKKLPVLIRNHVRFWIKQVESHGIYAVQKVSRYRDHDLKGERKGQRAVVLNKQWRLIYTISEKDELVVVRIEEVTPHDYRTK